MAHNLKYDLQILRGAGFEVVGPFGDTMISSTSWIPPEAAMVGCLVAGLLGMEMTPISTLIGKGKSQIGFAEVLWTSCRLRRRRCRCHLRLDDLLQPKLVAEDLDRLAQDVELPLVEVLAEMEWNGIGVDLKNLPGNKSACRIASKKLPPKSPRTASFNPDSPKQLSAALFNAEDADAPGWG